MKVLILNGGAEFGHSSGALNTALSDTAKSVLQSLGHETKYTHIAAGYDNATEVEKYLWADVIIYQMPAWWMGEPWQVKRYIDEVFMAGHGKLWQSDGRHRAGDPSKGYGTGGLVPEKKYMLSVTWNAPERAFTDPQEFFEGVGVDGVYLHFHKLNQFLAMKPLPTFMLNDVIKVPKPEEFIAKYQEHLKKVFG